MKPAMDDVNLLHFIIECLGAVVMFFMKQWINEEKGKLSDLQKNVSELEKQTTDVRLNYVQKNDFSEFKKELWDRFDKLTNKLENVIAK